MVSERLNKVLAAGSTDALFPMLADWPQDELRALIEDVETYGSEQEKNIEKGINVALFDKGYFLSDKATKMTLARAKEARIHLLGCLSEICSVAMLYLDGRPTLNQPLSDVPVPSNRPVNRLKKK